ncbi:HET domain-containing protein [Fusarium sp. LHS14.1]|nr:HET domain-containing protein [Fusarium sp. LHS14.1]
MSRWHKPSCHSPKVSVKDELPCCKSCGSSPNIQKLVSEQANLSTPWTLPSDENFGEMNLCWPESVQYSPKPAGTDSGEAEKAGDMGRQDELSPIYHKSLQEDQFRLLYLPSVDDENRPIHASLEAYQVDDCPEYETVSYCWGGENGDATLCRPVFLGDYWDILLQTQNCWSMLQYLRPQAGIRIIWVDAICINQMDHQERESQVAIMGSIYQQCLRAVVYLGQDVVRPRSGNTRTYPERRDLDTESASAVDLPQLFKMRYFQRVWVIQELILPRMVVIPVHGVELTARRHLVPREEVAWHESDAPWMRHLCAGKSTGQGFRVT